MRRLFIVPEPELFKPVKIGEAHRADGGKDDIFAPLHALRHTQIGAHYIDLINYATQENAELKGIDPAAWELLPEVVEWRASGSHVLLSTSLSHSEWTEDVWMNHPEIAVLPHPVREGNVKINERKPNAPGKRPQDPDGEQVLYPELRIKQKHIESLKRFRVRSTGKALGFDDNDTVMTLAKKAEAIMPQCRLGNLT